MAFLYIQCFHEIYSFKIIQFSFKGIDKLLNMFGKIYYILFFFKQDVRDKTRPFFWGSGRFLLIFIIYLVLFSFVQFCLVTWVRLFEATNSLLSEYQTRVYQGFCKGRAEICVKNKVRRSQNISFASQAITSFL